MLNFGSISISHIHRDTNFVADALSHHVYPLVIPRLLQFVNGLRYWTHTVSCSSCSAAYKRLNALEIALQVISIALIAAVAAAKQGAISIAVRYYVASMAVLCFVASKLLSHFIYKTFRYHDYDHSFFP